MEKSDQEALPPENDTDSLGARIGTEMMDRLQTPLWLFDIDRSRVVWANNAALRVWQADTLEDLTSREMGPEMSISVSQRLRQYQEDFERHDSTFTEVWTLYPNDVPITIDVIFRGFRLADGRMAMLCEGRSTNSNTPEALRSAEALLHTTVMISLYGIDGQPLYMNPAARASQLDIRANVESRFADAREFRKLMQDLERLGGCRISARIKTASGIRWHEIAARECRDAVTGNRAILFSENDISDLKETEERVRYLAGHDVLTGLPNRNFLQFNADRLLKQSLSSGQKFTFLLIDLDRFKMINDTLGHAAGDDLLVEVGDRLQAMVGRRGLVARLGGDEFLICHRRLDTMEQVDAFCTALMARLTDEMDIRGNQFGVTASIGVSRAPDDGADLATLLKHADVALYEAKEDGKNTWRHFSMDLRNKIEGKVRTEQDLRFAIERNEFRLFYQARCNALTNEIVGAEALIRWQHPTRGLLGPGDFIPVCEETSLIHEVGLWVLEETARMQVELARAGYPITLSLNLSARQFTRSTFLSDILGLPHRIGCDPSKLELEITESLLLRDEVAVLELLTAAKNAGFGIAIDDFGTGYSNLAYIQRYPISSLKIDRSFVQDTENSGAVTRLVIALCKSIGIKSVAEGVETQQQLDWLRAHDCQEYQGFLFSKPVPADEFRQLLAGNKPATARVVRLRNAKPSNR
ncbi:Bacteriophytochrome cph2 [Hartmannibacter diazotrophicus]|uniref:Bacteriophytochrome cph2 n=1 Tax=Hartmannibacter diazotrophicus TaxID=1482074 RepID=A0A2C9D2A9_9HYPH|nr:GGDEF domain-containing phosphodiesterase [Hartmannibacter diazotrophicus]SON54386.1 Bacteriophytochrome cph2 [Hartmannibacter diazotrophicus]